MAPKDAWAAIRAFGLDLSFPTYKQQGTGTAEVPYLELIVLFSFIVFIWEFYLDLRQYGALQRKDVPEALTARIGELDQAAAAKAGGDAKGKGKDGSTTTTLLDRLTSKFDAARKYSIDKAHLGFVESVFSQAEATAMLMLGSMPWFWDLSVDLAGKWFGKAEDEYIVSLVFLGINMVIENVVHLPFSLWAVFVVEQRHGFNKQSLKDFFLDKVKAIILSALLGGPMTIAVLYVIKAGGPNFFLYLYLLVLAFQLVLLTIYPTIIAPIFNKYEPLPEDSELKSQIDALASRVKFPLTKVFVVDGSRRSAHSNAYFYGFFKNKRIVLFDTLLTQVGFDGEREGGREGEEKNEHIGAHGYIYISHSSLPPFLPSFLQVQHSELLSILAHELGHWAHSHTFQMFFVSQVHLFLAFFLFSSSLENADLFSSFGFAKRPTIISLFLFFQAIWSPVDKALSFAFTLWTRKNEFQVRAPSPPSHPPSLSSSLPSSFGFALFLFLLRDLRPGGRRERTSFAQHPL